MARLRRRGPDGRGLYLSPDGRACLAHARLAIQDLSEAGAQPMADDAAEARVVVTFNGEIYNAPALRKDLESLGARFRSHADTEVLVQGYAHWGLDGLLRRLRGMFAFVILDRREPAQPRLLAAVDHAGMKPLVWTRFASDGGSTLALASDCDALIGALSESPGFSKRLDPTGLCHVLSVGYCPAPHTVWRGVHKLRPGEKLEWTMGEDQPPLTERYWSPPDTLEPETDTDTPDAFESLFRGVVDEHLLSDVPVGLFLSAGLDSGSIALALAQSQRSDDVTAWTLAGRGISPEFDESPVAARFAAALMMRHRSIEFSPADLPETLSQAALAFDEPQGFTALLTAVRIAGAARAAGLKVVLAGDGGDEAFGGYPWHSAGNHPISLDPAHGRIGRPARHGVRLDIPECDPGERARAFLDLAHRSYTHRALCRAFPGFHPDESRALLGAIEPEYDPETFASWLEPEDRPDLPHPRRSQRLDLAGFCAGSILPKIDRASMHFGLELRAPFLDRRLLEWAMTRSVSREASEGHSKPALRALLRRGVAAGLVPAELLRRPKQGFSLRLSGDQSLESHAAAVLPSSRLVRDGVLRKDCARFLSDDPDARRTRLFTLCMVAAWYENR